MGGRPRLPGRTVRCPACARPLRLAQDSLRCSRGHRYPEQGGVFDLLPPAASAPGWDPYATPFGCLYDSLVSRPPLAVPAALAAWGAGLGRMYQLMDASVRSEPGQVVLDVPAGSGASFARRPGSLLGSLLGFDLSRSMLRRAARRRRELRLEQRVLLARADATRLPLASASVDRALCFNGLHVIGDQPAVLRELRRVLKPAGRLVGSTLVADAPWPWRGNLLLARTARLLAPPAAAALEHAAAEAGFSSWTTSRAGGMLYFEAGA